MPRQARLDAPGTLHHVIVRGIEKRRIVDDTADQDEFVFRMGEIATDSGTAIFAWALMPNHAHILLKSAPVGLSGYMRRLLTGYAIFYNRRHARHGHLFQNRYKSIVCQEDAYFKELVRYIHLNPVRAKQVHGLAELDRYPWCGHAMILRSTKNGWLDRETVLAKFGNAEQQAKEAYLTFIQSGLDQGRRPDLVGGGLIRSMGGWAAVKSLRRSEHRELSDDRILGNGDFVDRLLREAGETTKRQFHDPGRPVTVDRFIANTCQRERVNINELTEGGRRGTLPRVRARLAVELVERHGLSLAETARRLGVSTSAISKIMRRAGGGKSTLSTTSPK